MNTNIRKLSNNDIIDRVVNTNNIYSLARLMNQINKRNVSFLIYEFISMFGRIQATPVVARCGIMLNQFKSFLKETEKNLAIELKSKMPPVFFKKLVYLNIHR